MPHGARTTLAALVLLLGVGGAGAEPAAGTTWTDPPIHKPAAEAPDRKAAAPRARPRHSPLPGRLVDARRRRGGPATRAARSDTRRATRKTARALPRPGPRNIARRRSGSPTRPVGRAVPRRRADRRPAHRPGAASAAGGLHALPALRPTLRVRPGLRPRLRRRALRPPEQRRGRGLPRGAPPTVLFPRRPGAALSTGRTTASRSDPEPGANTDRSGARRTFPAGLRGRSPSQITIRTGTLKAASAPPAAKARIASGLVSAPSSSATMAPGSSPSVGCGTGSTTASITSGCA